MESAHQQKGRGRGRSRPSAVGSLFNSNSESTIPKQTDANDLSTSEDVQSISTTTVIGRGRGAHLRPKAEVPDPHWSVSNLTASQFKSSARPTKPIELGIIGQQIEVTVNYFPIVQFPQAGYAYQYDIQMENKGNHKTTRHHRRVLYQCWLNSFCKKYSQINKHKIVFDNEKNIFTYEQQLPGIDETGIIEEMMGPNRFNSSVEYQISIKQVGNPIDMRSLHYLKELYQMRSDNNIKLDDLKNITQVLSVVLHESCSSNADFIYNRLFYPQPILENKHGHWNLGLGKAIWRGFYSCLVFAKGEHQLLMNLDVSHRVFMIKQSFLDFAGEVLIQSPRGRKHFGRSRKMEVEHIQEFLAQNISGEFEFLLKHCEHLSVRSHVLDNIIGYKIHGLGKPASVQKFNWNKKNNELITVENYYAEYYGIKLNYPLLPLVRMTNRSFVPMEFIDVMPVKVKKITDEQRASLCLKSSLPPPEYYTSIREIRQNPQQQCFEEDPFIKAWNISVDVNMLKVPARILPPPTVICTKQYRITPKENQPKGVWNSTNSPFYNPMNFPPVWALINLSKLLNAESCEKFYESLRDVAANRGMQCPAPVLYREYNAEADSIDRIIADLTKMMEENDDCTFFIVILPENDIRDKIYGDLKKLCELEAGFGIVTQMIRMKKKEEMYKWSYSKLDNILLKINTKLNGTNSIIDVPDNIKQFFSQGHRVMYVGIDLSHAAPGSSRRRSAVAVVASADNIPNRYFKEIYAQERSSSARGESWEYIVHMKEIMKSLISQYEQHQGSPPKAIVIYRDGISTSEFDTIFEKELMAIREACVELSPVYHPYLTYIVVNKKHHTRIFPNNDNPNSNVMAGTVVDSHDVTNPTTSDFFLTSHQGIKQRGGGRHKGQQGTSRPTHYHILYDDNKLTRDQVQMLTYALCYTYARCTRSISIPAPVKYADLLAFRAGIYININDDSNIDSVASGSDNSVSEDENKNTTSTSTRILLSSKLATDCPFFL